jgi:hypothetical protein
MSLDFKVNELYSSADLVSNLQLVHFYTLRSLWTDGDHIYMFKHLPMKHLKVKFELEKIKYDKAHIYLDSVTNNCCSPTRLGL